MNKKQWISAVMAAALLSGPILPAKGSAAASFSDIDGSYAKNAIMELANQGIVTGVEDHKFYPALTITRQDFAIILAKALQLDVSNPPATPTFKDVPPSSYAYSYVEAAVKAGLIQGTGNNLFGTGQNLSRQDMAVMFVRALGANPNGKAGALKFADSNQIADYAKESIAAAVEYGLITGEDNNVFNPDAKADRQAVALVASKLLKLKTSGNAQKPDSEKPETGEKPDSKPDTPKDNGTVTDPTPVVGGSSSSGSTRRSSSYRDLMPPTLDGTKFEAVDNYNGTEDQIHGLAGAVGEQGALVQAYPWTDANGNNTVEPEELGTAIPLGTSEADGSVSAVNIGDLRAGTYRFVITAKDSWNNESLKDAAHAVTVTLTKNEVPDTTAPAVNASKFEIIDNYNGTEDQIRGLAGAVGEQGTLVQAYPWTDLNENAVVDAGELGTPIPLGTSEADGSLNAANIGDLRAGTYRFVITTKDTSGNESAKDAAHAVTVTLTKNEVPDTTAPVIDASKFEAIDNYNGTEDQIRGLAGAVGEQGALVQAYPWTDANENDAVDAGELGTAIGLGSSKADGSVNAANIGDLYAGTYRFVITAKDTSSNESLKDAAHAIRVTLTKNEVPDTTAPDVDASKFEAIDNYTGTEDQLHGLAGAIGEQDALVQAYPWTDLNENDAVDAGELGTAIELGISEADGSVAAANIGNLQPGTYRFVITAKDASNNESVKDASHAVTVELVKGMLTTPTVTSTIYGFDGGISRTKQLVTGSTQSRVRFDFFSGESYRNGEIQVTMDALTFTTDDYYNISGWVHPTNDQISNNGHTLTFTGSNSGISDIAFELHDKVMPAPGTYQIRFKADADGPGTAKSYSEEQIITLVIIPPA
ncbi:S-layer homology domain-containing protein [Paenibacillus sp. 32352]|uniref:S-layer homology domain-containing protein n=1 Tax=Paenibacillus sp. 32352 TaxID=1969111 RepID=UPI0015C4CFCE|nr:S-layer homology domain-containing protein [Paenibacillus sp. 32352]